MKLSRCFLVLLSGLVLLPAHAAAQGGGGAALGDGRIVEQTAFALPSYEQIPDRFKRLYSRESVERMRAAADLELYRIKYLSDGLKVAGFIYRPKETAGRKLPAVIWNRGGVGEDTVIGVGNFNDLYEMYRYASEGFVVLASQYRGYDGGEGRDEVGGADTNDVVNLIPLARSLGYVDMDRIFMWGFSRGALMTMQAVRRGAPVRAAAVVGAVTDMALSRQENPGIRELARTHWPGPESRLEEHVANRSPVRWADKLTAPLLIFHGGADPAVSARQSLELARKMDEAGNLYELVVYAGDDHFVTLNSEERLRKTIDWFKNVRTIPVSQPLRETIRRRGVEAAVRQYRELKAQPGRYDLGEAQLNNLGYELMFTGRLREALEIFKLNVAAYPEAFNTYDSLGEAYLAAGDREQAARNYRKSLELNPQNRGAADALKKLGQN